MTQDIRQHPGNRVDHYHGRKFSAGKHVITYRYLFHIPVIDDSLINTFIMSAQNDELVKVRQLIYLLTVKDLSSR